MLKRVYSTGPIRIQKRRKTSRRTKMESRANNTNPRTGVQEDGQRSSKSTTEAPAEKKQLTD